MSPKGRGRPKGKGQSNFRGSTANSSVHVRRYTLHKIGKTVEEIAQQEGVSTASVRKSITTIDAFRQTNSVDYMNANLVDAVVSVNVETKQALKRGLTATVMGREGVRVPNIDLQLKAVEQVRELAKSVQPKGQGSRTTIPIMVNQQTAVTAPPTSESRFMGFEERLRKIRSDIAAHNQLPPPASVAAPLGEDEMSLEEEAVDVGATDTES